MLCSIEVQVGATEVLRWCQGKVTKKLKGRMLRGKEVPTVMIEWDGMPDVGGCEEGGFELRSERIACLIGIQRERGD